MTSCANNLQINDAVHRSVAAKRKGAKRLEPKLSVSSAHSIGCCRRRFFYLSRSCRLMLMIALTFGFFIIELVFGYISHSMALIADSFHMLSDVMALCIAFGCLKIAERRKTSKNTFGWVRAEVLGALVNGVFLLALCFTIFIESVQRLLDPEPIKNPLNVLLVGLIGFFINLVGMILFRGHVGHTHAAHGVEDVRSEVHEVVAEAVAACALADGGGTHPLLRADERRRRRCRLQRPTAAGHEASDDDDEEGDNNPAEEQRAISMSELEAVEESLMSRAPRKKSKSGGAGHLNMHAVFLHVVSDAVGSVIVIVTALVAWKVEGYEMLKLYMDPVLSIVLVCLMVCTTFPLVRETALILLQTTPSFVCIDSLQAELLNIDGIVAVHEFHVWRLVGERIIATVHIRFRTLRHYVLAAEPIRALFHDNHIHSTTIQPEFAEMDTSANVSELECAFACLPNNCAMLESGDVTCCGGKDKRTPPKKIANASTCVTIEEEEGQQQKQQLPQQRPNATDDGTAGGIVIANSSSSDANYVDCNTSSSI